MLIAIQSIIDFITDRFPEIPYSGTLEPDIRWRRGNHTLTLLKKGEVLQVILGDTVAIPPYINKGGKAFHYSLRKPLPYKEIEKMILKYWSERP